MCFVKFLFHFVEVAVGIDFAREKKMFLTGFTHRKVRLWKSCELDLENKLLVNRDSCELNYVKSAISILQSAVNSYSVVYVLSIE